MQTRNALQWTDSDAWQPGYVQRLETAELVKILAAEGRKLQSAADEAEKMSEQAQELYDNVSRQEAKLARTMEGVGALFSLLNTALEDSSFTRDPEAAVEAQTALENEALRDTDVNGGKKRRRPRRLRGGGGLQSSAARVRATPHRNRTDDEKKWLALDAVVNPQLYHHVTLAEAEEMRWDALYYTRLDREDVLRVLSLPPQVQLALPFLHTPVEVAAHELLARYSHGIDPDHFARLDKDSQDACDRTIATSSTTGGGSTAATAAESGDDITGDGTATKRGPTRGTAATAAAAPDDPTVATRRVLACMRRAFEAHLKIPAEQDDDEAVWCALDKKLRADLYRDSDEAAADRAEEMCREADAREDARHTWLATESSGDTRTAAEAKTSTSEFARAVGSPIMGSVVEEKKVAEEAAAVKKVAEDRQALVARVSDSFSEDHVKALAAAAVVGSLQSGPLRPGTWTAAAVGNEEWGCEHEGRREFAKPSGGADEGAETFALAPTKSGGEHNVEAASQRKDGDRRSGDDSFGSDDGNESNDHDEASKLKEGRKRKPAEERRRLSEIVQKVLPLFLVSEEETPLGRDMTRSLAMLQEVALRLGRGQRNIFSGLNPQSAVAILQSRPLSRTSVSSSAQGLHAAAAAAPASTPPEGARVAGEGGLQGAAAAAEGADRECRKDTMSMDETAAAAARGTGAEALTSSYLEAKPSRSDGTVASSTDSAAADSKHLPLSNETNSTAESRPWRENNTGGSGDPGRNNDGSDCSTVSQITQQLDKAFGSWEEVHPAALGIRSQEEEFVAGEGSGVHPASFRTGASSKGIKSCAHAPRLFCVS